MTAERSLEDDYKAAGFGGTLPFGERPALLIVDFARAYLDPASPLYAGVEAELDVTRTLAAAARQSGVPLIWTRVSYDAELRGADGGLFRRKVPALACFEEGNPLAEFAAPLHPAPGEMVVVKHYPSAFFGTPLAANLTAMRIDTLVIAGLSTSGCVRASALDALCHGFAPFVVSDACGDRDERVQRANLFDLGAKYAEVVSAEWVRGRLASS